MKKLIAAAAALAAVSAFSVAAFADAYVTISDETGKIVVAMMPIELTDNDGDGNITANDALMILRASVGMETLTPEQSALADVDGDGSVTANDALAVLRYSIGFIDEDSRINKPITA